MYINTKTNMKQPIVGLTLGIMIQGIIIDFAKPINSLENKTQIQLGVRNISSDGMNIQVESPDLNMNNLLSENNNLVNAITEETNKANWEGSNQSKSGSHSKPASFPSTIEVEGKNKYN